MKQSKILIVEDEIIIAHELSEFLKENGYIVSAMTKSAEDAIKRIPEIEPDLILMDVILQGELDGIKGAAIIKERYGIPIIFLTALKIDTRFGEINKSESYYCIMKPFNEKELLIAIEVVLNTYEMKRHLLYQSRKLRIMLNNMDQGVISISSDRKIEFINNKMEQFLGTTKDELLGKDLIETVFIFSEKKVNVLPELLEQSASIDSDKILFAEGIFYLRNILGEIFTISIKLVSHFQNSVSEGITLIIT